MIDALDTRPNGLPPLDSNVVERFRCDFEKGTKLCDEEDHAIILAALADRLSDRARVERYAKALREIKGFERDSGDLNWGHAQDAIDIASAALGGAKP